MSLGPESIKKVVALHLPQVQGCYQRTLAKANSAEGKLATAWVIDTEGLVKGAKIEREGTTLEDPTLHECVLAVLSGMSFPRPMDGKEQPVSFPFNLRASAPGFLAAGSGRTVRLTVETTKPGIRLVDLARGTTVCEGRCGVLVSAEPYRHYVIRAGGACCESLAATSR